MKKLLIILLLLPIIGFSQSWKDYKPSNNNHMGMREKVKRGHMSVDDVLEIITQDSLQKSNITSVDFLNWLRIKKATNFRPVDQTKKTRKDKKKKKNAKKTKNNSSLIFILYPS